MKITRENIDELLDKGQLEVAMRNGRWWRIRRNGKTHRWVRDPNRIRVPYAAGLYVKGQITEHDFFDQWLDPAYFRIREESAL